VTGRSRRQPSARPALREGLVLVAGALSAGALLFAALSVVGEPGPAARASLARAAGEVADAVGAEWERLLREEAPPAQAVAGPFVFAPLTDARRPPPEARPVRPPPGGVATAFDALLAEARRLQLGERRDAEALDTALDALAVEAPPLRRAEGRLLAIQLAAREGRPDVVAEQWDAARGELSGDETLGDTSALLLCGLAAAPALDAAARAEAAGFLAEAWCGNRLVLPVEGDALVADGPPETCGTLARSPRREALRRRLQALLPPSDAAAAGASSAHDAHGARAALAADAVLRDRDVLLAALGAQEPHPSTAGRWELAAADPVPVVWRREPEGALRIATVTGEGLRLRLARSIAESALVPEGFLVDMGRGHLIEAGGVTAETGAVVRERTPLAGDLLGVTVRHLDPAAFVDSERARAVWLRWALLLMALFSVGAALATVRAMRRERALAALRSAFVASVSHELRTPVSSLLLMTENLAAGRVADEAARARYHGLIRKEAVRLRRLVDDVLDVSRLERGEPLTLRREEVAPAPFVRDLAAALDEHVRAAGGTLAVETAGLPQAASLDTDAVRRAVLNLAENALRHSGSKALTFTARGAGDAAALVLAVADEGRGVPRAARARIFEPFARLAPDGGAPGTGLGLSIVRAIAEGHGGSVAVRDREGGPGAVFEIRIPVNVPEEALWPSAS
jgi:signal transduction histidine kinase